jgi:propionate CoA-transferase
VAEVEQRTFSGSYARQRGQPALYITERCVFCLSDSGLVLTEIAPGVDIDRDILSQMEFRPAIAESLATMNPRIFRPEVMGLRDDLLTVPLEERFVYDPQQDLFFVNLSQFTVKSLDQVEQIRNLVVKRLRPLGRKTYAIVNYDGFGIMPEVLDAYSDMVKWLMENYYSGATRYTTSGFLRVKLGESLEQRGVAAHIYEGADEARNYLRGLESGPAGSSGGGPSIDVPRV